MFNQSSSSLSSSSPSSVVSPPISRRHGRHCCLLRPIARLIEQIWRHFLPFAPLAHLISILLLILPDLVFRPADELRADVETAYANTTACRLRPINASSAASSSCLVDSLFAPVEGLFSKLVATDASTTTTTTTIPTVTPSFDKEYFARQIDTYSLELVSLCLAFATISIRYGSVFWYTNKTLSYIITFVGLVNHVFNIYVQI